MRCDVCGKRAPVHLTEVIGGKPVERHLCAECAAAQVTETVFDRIKRVRHKLGELLGRHYPQDPSDPPPPDYQI